MLPGIPFTPIRDTLYTVEELLEGFDPRRPESLAETRDFRIFRWAVQHGAKTPAEPLASMLEALHDNSISQACVRHLLRVPRVAAIMGGHRVPRGSPAYRAVANLSRALSREGFLLASGGGPGAMEATHLGALLCRTDGAALDDAVARLATVPDMPDAAGLVGPDGEPAWDKVAALHRWQAEAVAVRRGVADPGPSLAVPTWFFGTEPFTPLATSVAKYFQNSIREDGLLALAAGGIVYAEGWAGTVQEVFQDAALNYYAAPGQRTGPMVFLGVEYWTRTLPVRPLIEALLRGGASPPGTRLLFTDDVAEAVRFLGERPANGAQRDLMARRAVGPALDSPASALGADPARSASRPVAPPLPAPQCRPVAAAPPQPPRPAASASSQPGPVLRIATFNVENLAHPGAWFYGRENEAPYSDAAYQDKIAWIGRILDEGRVDLVGFQELFSWRAAEDAARSSVHLAGGGGLTVLAPELRDGRNERTGRDGRTELEGPHVGLATRLPVLGWESVAEFPSAARLSVAAEAHGAVGQAVPLPLARFERPVLRARVLLPGEVPATVFVAHLKSKRPKFLEGEDLHDPVVQAAARARSLVTRAAEAVALRALAAAVLRDPPGGKGGEPVIVLGDLNDDLGAVTTELVAGEEPSPAAGAEAKRRIWDTILYDVHALHGARGPRDAGYIPRYSHVHGGRYELLDHILVSQELVHQNPARLGEVRQTRIFNDHLQGWRPERDDGAHAAHSHDAPRLRQPGTRSDHGVPVTEIRMLLRPGGGSGGDG